MRETDFCSFSSVPGCPGCEVAASSCKAQGLGVNSWRVKCQALFQSSAAWMTFNIAINQSLLAAIWFARPGNVVRMSHKAAMPANFLLLSFWGPWSPKEGFYELHEWVCYQHQCSHAWNRHV